MCRKKVRLLPKLLLVCILYLTTNTAVAAEIAFWSHWGPAQTAPVSNTIIPQFKAATGIDVVLTHVRPMDEKLTLATVAGTAPDVVVVKSNAVIPLVKAGLLQPIERFVATSTVIRKTNYDPATWNLGFYQGHMYGVPAIEVGPVGGLIYNRVLFANTGLPDRVPANLREFSDYHRKLTKSDATGTLQTLGFHPMMAGGSIFWHSLYDVDWYDDATGRVNFTSADTLTMVNDMSSYLDYAGFLKPGANRFPLGDWTSGFATGKIGMMFAGYYTLGELAHIENVNEADFGYGYMPSPKGDKWILPRGWLLAIPAGAKNPEAALKFIERFIEGDGPQAFWDTQGWLNGNLRFMSRLANMPRSSGIWFFIDSLTKSDRLGAYELSPDYNAVMSAWEKALWSIFERTATPYEALSNIERQFNN